MLFDIDFHPDIQNAHYNTILMLSNGYTNILKNVPWLQVNAQVRRTYTLTLTQAVSSRAKRGQ